jgi:hypothetical protein
MSQRLAYITTPAGPAPVLVMLEHGPFIVHQTSGSIIVDDTVVFGALDGFTLTHTASGFSVAQHFDHPGTALEAAKAIESRADRTFTAPGTPKEKWSIETRERVVDAVNQLLPADAKKLKATA